MTRIRFTSKFALFLFVLLISNALYFWLTIDPVDVSVSLDESGLIETVQLVYLATAALLFFFAAATLSGAERMFCVAIAILCLVFFLREFEAASSGPFTAYLESRSLRIHETLLVAGIGISYMALRWNLMDNVVRFAFSRAAWPFYVAGILLLAGAIFDIFHGSVPNQIKEEILECSCYLALLLIAGAIALQQPSAIVRSRSGDVLMGVLAVALFAGACWLTVWVHR